MAPLPLLVACFLALLAVCLLWRSGTRWAGLLLGGGITAFAALISGVGAIMTLDAPSTTPATSRHYALAAAVFALVSMALVLAGVWSVIGAWRRSRPHS